jgi:hypothetical protein
MKRCCTTDCENLLSPNSRLRTCVNCRATIHRWDKRPTGEIVNYFQQLRVRTARMSTFAVIKIDEDKVIKKPHEELERKGLVTFAKRKKKVKK